MSRLDNLLLHSSTKQQLDLYLKNPPHAVLLTAVTGSGKKTVAFTLASALLGQDGKKDIQSHPFFTHIKRQKSKKDISIEQIRETIHILSLKTTGTGDVRRVVFIEDAHDMSTPAQNALLKILEEPSADTVFILSAISKNSILPTIASRAQQIVIQPPTLKNAQEFWKEQNDSDVSRAWKLSQGSVGLASALLTEDKEHALMSAVNDVKTFLTQKTYTRLLTIDKLSKNKEEFIAFLEALARTLQALNHSAVQNGRVAQSKRLLESRKAVLKAYDSLEASANTRLVALRMVLKLRV